MQLEEKQRIKKAPYYQSKAKKQPGPAANFFKYFLLSFCIMSTLALAVYWDEARNLYREIKAIARGEQKPRLEFTLPFSQKRQNILVMGVDVNHDNGTPFENTRSDSMILVSIAPKAKDVNIISIPRDSKVYIAGSAKPDKINHAFAKGGAQLSIKTVEETFGIRVNRYLAVSNQGAINFIDKIGGLPIYVEKDMRYGDRSAGLYVDLKKGHRKLTGIETEGYLRYRNDELGDIGRIGRQQWFFNAVSEALKDPQTLTRLPEAIKSSAKYIQTDMSLLELSQYAMLAKTIDKSDIQMATLPGAPSTKGEVSYWILDPDKTQSLIDKLVYRDKAEMLEGPLSAGILYTPDNLTRANEVRALLEQNGVEVKMQSRERLNHDQIAIHNIDVPLAVINQLKKTAPELKNKQTVYDQIGLNRAGKDFTIVLSGL